MASSPCPTHRGALAVGVVEGDGDGRLGDAGLALLVHQLLQAARADLEHTRNTIRGRRGVSVEKGRSSGEGEEKGREANATLERTICLQRGAGRCWGERGGGIREWEYRAGGRPGRQHRGSDNNTQTHRRSTRAPSGPPLPRVPHPCNPRQRTAVFPPVGLEHSEAVTAAAHGKLQTTDTDMAAVTPGAGGARRAPARGW